MTPKANIQNDNVAQMLKPREGENFKHLGDLVGWSVGGLHEKQLIEDLLDYHSLKDDFQLPNICNATAYRRAVTDSCKQGVKDSRRYDCKKVEENLNVFPVSCTV